MAKRPAVERRRPDDLPGRRANLTKNSQDRSVGWAIAALALPVLAEQFCSILVGLVDTHLAGLISPLTAWIQEDMVENGTSLERASSRLRSLPCMVKAS